MPVVETDRPPPNPYRKVRAALRVHCEAAAAAAKSAASSAAADLLKSPPNPHLCGKAVAACAAAEIAEFVASALPSSRLADLRDSLVSRAEGCLSGLPAAGQDYEQARGYNLIACAATITRLARQYRADLAAEPEPSEDLEWRTRCAVAPAVGGGYFARYVSPAGKMYVLGPAGWRAATAPGSGSAHVIHASPADASAAIDKAEPPPEE